MCVFSLNFLLQIFLEYRKQFFIGSERKYLRMCMTITILWQLRYSNLFNKYFESDLINFTIKIGLNRWQSITIQCYEVTYLKHVWHGWKPKVSKYEMEKYELLKIWTVKKNQDGVKFRISGSRDFVSYNTAPINIVIAKRDNIISINAYGMVWVK